MGKKGNVEPEEVDIPKTAEVFEEGDIAALSPAALRIGRLKEMSPRMLHKIGHPNEFIVLDSFVSEEHGLCITLWPCCYRFIHRDSGKIRCKGHQAALFEKKGAIRQPKKGDKSTSVSIPLLGQILGVTYQDDETNPELNANIFGFKSGVTGVLAKLVKKYAEDAKIL